MSAQQIAISESPLFEANSTIITSTHFQQSLVSEVVITPPAPALPVFSDSSNLTEQPDNDSSDSSNSMRNFDCAVVRAIEALLTAIAGEPMPTSIYLYPRKDAEHEQCLYARLAWHTNCAACYTLAWPVATLGKGKRKRSVQNPSYGWKLFSAGAPGYPSQV